ncbi:MAG: hypothetical protein ACOYZ8_04520 [Chloroflexota bacterium]
MKAFRRYVLFLLILSGGLSVYVQARYQPGYPRALGLQPDAFVRQTVRRVLEQTPTQIVMLGDSLLQADVDAAVLSTALGVEIYSVRASGSASALWYLVLENNIVEAERKPRALIMLFRDTMLTLPGYRVHGSYFIPIDEYAAPDDLVFIERAYVNRMNPLEKLAEAYLPVYGARLDLRKSLDAGIRYTPPRLFLQCDAACTNGAMDAVFRAANLEANLLAEAVASAEAYLYTPRALDFDASVDDSFLPEIVRLCRENGIQLIFVRARTLRFDSEPPGLKTYMDDLASYLDERGIPFLDFSRDERLVPALFADNLHLNEAGRIVFTEILAEALKPVLK